MSAMTTLMLFAVFGVVCGFYLSIVGFAVTSIGICLVVGLASAILGGPFTPLLIFEAFVAQQVGFFIAVAGRAIALHLSRLRAQSSDSPAEAEFQAERDQL